MDEATHRRVEGGVTAPRGFRAVGVSAGLKSSGKPDIALLAAVKRHQRTTPGQRPVLGRGTSVYFFGTRAEAQVGRFSGSSNLTLARRSNCR